MQNSNESMPVVNAKMLFEIFIIFFKIGAFTFGGGFAMIPLIEREMVENKNWVKKDEITDLFAVSQCIPGSIAINTASLIGYKIAGKVGCVVATLGVLLPSFLIITVIAAFFSKFSNIPIVKSVLFGIRSCVVGLIIVASISVSKTAIKDRLCILFTVITIICVVFFKLNPIFVILASIIPGIIILKYIPSKADSLLGKNRSKNRGEVQC